jgi:hypothetical protein
MAQETTDAKSVFLKTIKEPEYVIVSPEMEAAGVDRLEELASSLFSNRRYLVHAIYCAMEYERRSAK